MRRFRAALVALVCVAGAAGAQPLTQSLRATRAQDGAEQALAGEVAYTNGVCGLSMSSAIDWPSASDWDGAALVGACDRALGAIEASCRGGKPALVAALTRFVCAGDGAGPSIRNRTFRFGAAPGGDGFDETRALLQSGG